MSFIYAEKQKKYYSDGKAYFSTNICSDTKITLCGAVHMNWCEKQAELIKLYGMVKSIIVFPNCCISFAGNDIFLANRLLTYLLDKQTFEIDDAIRYAFNLHLNANPNDIEFIICFADDENQTHITCIKEGKINNDCHSAWIGSPIAFNKLQELYLTELSK